MGLYVLGFTVSASAADYTITDLGTLGGTSSAAFRMNGSGAVAGYSSTSSGSQHAFVFSGTAMVDLGTLGGTASQALGISASGQVVGYANLAGDGSYQAYVYNGMSMTGIGTLGGADSSALAINKAGQIVGWSYTATGDATHAFFTRAFLYQNGTMTDLGTLGGAHSTAYDINDAGQIVGWSYTAANPNLQPHPFLYSGGQMSDLGPLGGSSGYATSINQSGQVCGWADLAGDTAQHAYLYSGGVMHDLGTLVWPPIVPIPAIWPTSLMLRACVSVQPEDGSISEFRSAIALPLYRNAWVAASPAISDQPTTSPRSLMPSALLLVPPNREGAAGRTRHAQPCASAAADTPRPCRGQ
jgi:probable HAF family extracellular repeat protein